ncbi:MAG TPA: AcvB/VirJ family lysyl-phosphatidylglycerol hydrolase [Gemmatimonadaceae bacterium]|nr:AcvB/VirJ family lysyl-phosphatidylglycerol hydrolase [Gemmatimonadaceae bacterium]
MLATIRALVAALALAPALTFALPAQSPAPVATAPAADTVGDLPLTEVPARAQGGALLGVILTGDGGFATLDKLLADSMAARGIPVVALDSRAYLTSGHRTADGASRDLERILRHYLSTWGKSRVLLVGYSRGADLLPFMASRLPTELFGRIDEVAMLGLAPNANFTFHLVDLISNHKRKDDLPTVPEVAKLRGKRVLCFHGADEKESGCPALPADVATVVEMPGGHHFGGRYGEIATRILDGVR